eukprot:g4288.t1
MVSAEDIRYFSWPYFFALVILSAGVIFPLAVMIRKGWQERQSPSGPMGGWLECSNITGGKEAVHGQLHVLIPDRPQPHVESSATSRCKARDDATPRD